ncbi:hypothetical protein KKC97_01850 [bacterium]|nr:hypothetical protein [bacterium]RQV97360.1 MAG: hypothetical protein EH220_04760 [bacterium]
MSSGLDLLLVIIAVAAALGYMIWRKAHSARKVRRDWASGHPESCAGCGIMEIRRAQLKAKKN